MTTPRDDDALRWEGDDDPTLQVRRSAGSDATDSSPTAGDSVAAGSSDSPDAATGPGATDTATTDSVPTDSDPLALPDGYTAVGKGADEVGRIREDGTVVMPGDRAAMGNATLVTLGILGGIYVLYTIGWIVAGERLRVVARLLVAEWAYQPAFWCALFAPLLWFATTYVATRDSATWVRMSWLVAGVLLLVPWPFVMVGAVGR